MDNEFIWFYFGIALGAIVAISAILILGLTYRDGQIDAINGVIKYELVKQPDNTTKWIRKD